MSGAYESNDHFQLGLITFTMFDVAASRDVTTSRARAMR